MPANGKDTMTGAQSPDPAGLSQAMLSNGCLYDAMARIHEAKIDLCRQLEAIADSLPGDIDPVACMKAAQALIPVLREAHRFEEAVVFPAYDDLLSDHAAPTSTSRLRTEHIEDECFAADLTEILLKLGHGEQITNAETFGFMLRGFFDGVRRHIAFENEHITPVIRAAEPRSA